MTERGGSRRPPIYVAGLAATIGSLTIALACGTGEPRRRSSVAASLRVGVSQWSAATNPLQGLRQMRQILLVEGLARTGEDGRLQPVLAEAVTVAADHRSVLVKLRRGVKFHDGSPADAAAIAAVLPDALRGFLGFAFSDIDYIRPNDSDSVEIGFRESSPLLTEALEVSIQKPNGASTGPFAPAGDAPNRFPANRDYYLGVPSLSALEVESYPTVRAAWAELLRNRIDMLWEVAPDALASMEKANSISVFTFTRRYQYLMALNPRMAALKSSAVRRALNLAVDRSVVVRNALNSYGVASTGPLWPRNWAMPSNAAQFRPDPATATTLLKGAHLKFSCLIPPDAPYERLALEVKRQLALVGVEMIPEEVSYDEQSKRAESGNYEAILTELISGPTLVRPYLVWHSNGPFNWGRFGNATVDSALDRLRHAASDDEVRAAVGGVQQAFVDDPPAVFLAWSVRARAISKRFDVQAEEGRDVLSTIRLWKPAGISQRASRN
jgi:peptide/nickel transport system substrate-binding protein